MRDNSCLYSKLHNFHAAPHSFFPPAVLPAFHWKFLSCRCRPCTCFTFEALPHYQLRGANGGHGSSTRGRGLASTSFGGCWTAGNSSTKWLDKATLNTVSSTSSRSLWIPELIPFQSVVPFKRFSVPQKEGFMHNFILCSAGNWFLSRSISSQWIDFDWTRVFCTPFVQRQTFYRMMREPLQCNCLQIYSCRKQHWKLAKMLWGRLMG